MNPLEQKKLKLGDPDAEMGPNSMGENPMPDQAPQFEGDNVAVPTDAVAPTGGGALRTLGMNIAGAGAGFGQGLMGQRMGRAFSQGQGGLRDLIGLRKDQIGLQEIAQGTGRKPGNLEGLQKRIAEFKAKFGGPVQ